MDSLYNMRSPAVRRLMKEAQELSIPTEDYYAQPVEDNLFEWHFTVRGPSESEFEGGLYHGRIILPPDYPMKPPSIILLNPNGRFDVNKKICLSISGHHPESWQPSWSIRTALLALIGFMPTHGGGAIGSLDYTTEERASLAKKSRSWICSACGTLENILCEQAKGMGPSAASREAKELAAQISFKGMVQEAETTSISQESAQQKQSLSSVDDDVSTQLHRRSHTTNVTTSTPVINEEVPVPILSQAPIIPFSTILMWLLGAAIAALVVRRIFFV